MRQLQRRAAREGRGRETLSALRIAYDRLCHDPDVFGEPSYRLRAVGMEVRKAVIDPLVVHFAVCEDRPLVFIKGVDLLPLP